MPPQPPSAPPAHPPDSPDIYKYSCHQEYGAGDCSEFNFCNAASRNGECVHGVCSCADGFLGADCGIKAECTFWDEELLEYSTRGCVVSPPPGGEPDGFLHCLCNHLTDFSVLRFPASLQDLLAELASITFNTFSAQDALRFFTSFNPAKNPTIMKYVGSIVGLWLITLVFARFRLHRRMLTNARAARKARLEKHKELLSKMREKRQSNGKLASRTLTKDDELRSDEGVVQSKLSLAWVRGEDDAENDDRPPQEGGEVRALKQTVSMKMPTYAAATTLDASTMKKEYLVAREASHAKALDVLTNIRAPAMPPKLVSMPSMQHEVAHRKLQSRVPIASASLGDDGWAPASRPSRQVDSSDLKNDNPVPIARVGPDAVWAPASRPISKLSRRGQGQSGLEHLVLTPASLPQPPSRSPTGRRRIGDPARNLTVKPGRSRVEPPTGSADISNVEGREERRDLVDPPPPDASNALALHSASCKPHIPALTPTVRSNVLAADNITSDGKEGLGATQTLTFSWKRATAKAHVQGDKSSMADVVMVASLYRRGSSGHISAAAYANEKASAAAASARAKAKKSVRDVGEIFHLIRTCQLKTLTQRVLNYVGNWFKKLVSTARGEHTVVSFLWPTDIDGALFDTQCVQIFWNVLVLESVLLAMLFSNLPSQVSPTLVTLIIQALITVFPCVVAAVVLRLMFRVGNRGLRRRVVREREHTKSAQKAVATSEAYLEWKANKIKRRRSPGERLVLTKFVFAWFLALSMFVVCLLMLMIYAMTFGEKKMQSFLLSIVLSLSSDFLIIEPIEILLIVSLPFLLDNNFMLQIRTRAQDLGFL